MLLKIVVVREQPVISKLHVVIFFLFFPLKNLYHFILNKKLYFPNYTHPGLMPLCVPTPPLSYCHRREMRRCLRFYGCHI